MNTFDKLKMGAALLTFDDNAFDTWIAAIPLFRKYHAHATFFFLGNIDEKAIDTMRELLAAGHTVGLHTINHAMLADPFTIEAAETFFAAEIKPQLNACREAGIEINFLAYPNNRHSPELDDFLVGKGFRRFRAGVSNVGYRTNNPVPLYDSIDAAFFPVADAANLDKTRVLNALGIGEYYRTDVANVLRALKRARDRNECVSFFSHAIYPKASHVSMPTETLESILAEAERIELPVIGVSMLDSAVLSVGVENVS